MTIPNDNPILNIEELFGLNRDMPEPKKLMTKLIR